jgi:beta-lactamase regulating signal transducer with metallopeptidase domain
MLWWTIQNVVIAALLAGLVRLACRLRPIGPVGRHALWLVVLAKLLTPPLVAWPWAVRTPLRVDPAMQHTTAATPAPLRPANDAPAATPDHFETMEAESGGAVAVAPPQTAPPASSIARRPPVNLPSPRLTLDRLIAWAAATWIAGGVAFALLQCVRIVRMLRRLRNARPADDALARRVERLAQRMGARQVRAVVLPGIDSPLVWSLCKPLLVWPAQMRAADMSPESIDGLVVHELAHVKRRDHWVGWLELAAGCAWWWNPLFWYVRHQLRENAELACDAWVVDALPAAKGRRAYAEALLAVCEGMSLRRPKQTAAPMPALGLGTGGRRFLERRLAMILRERAALRLPRLGLVIVGLLAAATLPAWSQKVPGSGGGGGAGDSASGAPDAGQQSAAYGDFFRSIGAVGLAAPQARSLPSDAQELVTRFDAEQAEARRQLEDRLAARRAELVKQLQELQDRYAKDGRLDGAIAIRDRVRQMQEPGGGGAYGRFGLRGRLTRVAGDPGDLTAYRQHVGESFNFRVTGRTDGAVWGSDVYTDDSTLAAAAVHAGILSPGEDGRVRVTILPGQSSYEGTNRNGVTSSSYGPWPGSYRIERLLPSLPRAGAGAVDTGPGPAANAAASVLQRMRGHAGDVVLIELVGSTQGTVWGTDVYTDDSSLPAAAVHSGALRDGERGMVQITILPGQENYPASTHNGVASQTWGPWDGSFRIERANVAGGGDGDFRRKDPRPRDGDSSGFQELRGR